MELPARKPIVIILTIVTVFIIIFVPTSELKNMFISNDDELTTIEQANIKQFEQAASIDRLYLKRCEEGQDECSEKEQEEWAFLMKYKKICEDQTSNPESQYQGCKDEVLYNEIEDMYDNSKVLSSISEPESTFSTTQQSKEYLGEISNLEDFSQNFQKNVKSILYVETKNKALDEEGFPTVRFECHIYNNPNSRYCREFRSSSDEKLDCNINSGESFSRESAHTNKEAFLKAADINEELAICSSSFGTSQVMGFNYRSLGLSSIDDFYEIMKEGKEAQISLMIKYISSRSGLKEELEKEEPNWATVARLYNGEGYKENNYDVKLAQASEALSNIATG
jgi:hypothetical protein